MDSIDQNQSSENKIDSVQKKTSIHRYSIVSVIYQLGILTFGFSYGLIKGEYSSIPMVQLFVTLSFLILLLIFMLRGKLWAFIVLMLFELIIYAQTIYLSGTLVHGYNILNTMLCLIGLLGAWNNAKVKRNANNCIKAEMVNMPK
jgi:hypothetical protein